MKKTFVFVLILCLCYTGVCFSVSAIEENVKVNNSALNSAVFDVTSLGIIMGDENGNLNVTQEINRAEFAKIMAVLLGCENLDFSIQEQQKLFQDVPENYWANSYINCVVAAGIMEGDTEGTFRPQDSVSLQEAIKTLVCLLGYEVDAHANGGYPLGHQVTAQRIGLLDNVEGERNKAAKRGDVIVLVSNALDIPKMVSDYAQQPTYTVQDNDTLRSFFEEQKDLYCLRGVVTANYRSWLEKPISGITETQVEIDGILFEAGNTQVQNLLGQDVRIYYKQSEDMKNPIIQNVQATSDNLVLEIQMNNVKLFQNSVIEYFTEEGTEKYLFQADTKFLYNNRMLNSFQEEFSSVEMGNVLLISNDGDETIDYVFVSEYENYVIEHVSSSGNLKLKKLQASGDKVEVAYSNLLLQTDLDETYSIEDCIGEKIAFEELKVDQVISVFENPIDGVVRIKLGQEETVTGVPSEIQDGDTITVNGNSYEVATDIVFDVVQTKRNYQFYFDYTGAIAYCQEDLNGTADWEYGCIVEAKQGTFGNITLKIAWAGNVENREEKDYADKTNDNTTPITLCRNSSTTVYDVTERIRIDEQRVEPSVLLNYIGVPMRCYIDANQQLSGFDTLELVGGGSQLRYNAEEHVFGGIRGVEPFLFNETTKVICMPSNTNATDEDLLSYVNLNNKDTMIRYEASGYELDEETGAVGIFVIKTEMKSDNVDKVYRSTSKFGLIRRILHTIDESGEPNLSMEIFTDGELQSKQTPPLTGEFAKLKDLKDGDFIFYSEDPDGNIVDCIVADNVRQIEDPYHNGQYSEEETLVGYPVSIRKNQIDNINLRQVHEIDVQSTDLTTIKLERSNSPDIFLYHTESEIIEMATVDDIITGQGKNGDKILVLMPNEKVRAIVIIR